MAAGQICPVVDHVHCVCLLIPTFLFCLPRPPFCFTAAVLCLGYVFIAVNIFVFWVRESTYLSRAPLALCLKVDQKVFIERSDETCKLKWESRAWPVLYAFEGSHACQVQRALVFVTLHFNGNLSVLHVCRCSLWVCPLLPLFLFPTRKLYCFQSTGTAT